jgi:RNA recognition motif-containing protein
MSIRLYIGNLPKSDVERQDLQAVFEEAGEAVSAKVIKDRKTGKCRGFGFLTVEDESQADAIIEKYNGAMFQELAIKLEKALPKSEEDENQAATPRPTAGHRERPSTGSERRSSGGGKKGDRRKGGNAAATTTYKDDTSFQPDPRWADQLAALKERFAEVSQ